MRQIISEKIHFPGFLRAFLHTKRKNKNLLNVCIFHKSKRMTNWNNNNGIYCELKFTEYSVSIIIPEVTNCRRHNLSTLVDQLDK